MLMREFEFVFFSENFKEISKLCLIEEQLPARKIYFDASCLHWATQEDGSPEFGLEMANHKVF